MDGHRGKAPQFIRDVTSSAAAAKLVQRIETLRDGLERFIAVHKLTKNAFAEAPPILPAQLG
ncbi:hypothetical protein [Rhizobium esperanzae]|uniref:Uncharacterized protein n=1 Tax=Rhizobium esperanzae TaxID=1967781 RepID=A0A7W6R2E5_9HYPH|nr:hypothetical protein [Rhizobium esperanzae]MBB4234997.1 hypothetical protein [Rhizobium esperanzae]